MLTTIIKENAETLLQTKQPTINALLAMLQNLATTKENQEKARCGLFKAKND
jgi:hypothetical protein